MTTQLIFMKGDEFVNRILNGERDFSKIKLEEGFNLNKYEGFSELNQYLVREDRMGKLKEYPITINNSQFLYFIGRGLYLPYVQGKESNLHGADLSLANLFGADLSQADLSQANLFEADLHTTNLSRTNLRGTDVRCVKNLKRVLNLGFAVFYETKITPKEEKIIKEVLENMKLFKVFHI